MINNGLHWNHEILEGGDCRLPFNAPSGRAHAPKISVIMKAISYFKVRGTDFGLFMI